ncbi:MAG: hypothetical protein ABIH85_06020, partial [Candidatus Omnitrophota bacterium]
GWIDNGDTIAKQAGAYMQGHSLLPANYDNLSPKLIQGMGKLLFQKGTAAKTKEAILILLAHQNSQKALLILKKYNQSPDLKLKFFAKCAVDECEMWCD